MFFLLSSERKQDPVAVNSILAGIALCENMLQVCPIEFNKKGYFHM